MIRIALCDDDKKTLPVIAGAARSAFQNAGMDVEIQLFHSGEELLERMRTQDYQLVLLDIEMPGLDGIEVGKRIRAAAKAVELVYVSEREDRVFDTFDVQPFGFVRKTSFLNDIADLADMYLKKRASVQAESHIEFSTRTSLISIRLKSIRYIEGSGNYQKVYRVDQAEPLEIKMTMEKLEEKLRPNGFIRIHKGFIVNSHFIFRIDVKSLVLLDGTELPISRTKAVDIKVQYLSMLGQ